MIERFNGRIAEVLATTRFDSAEHFADTIKRYVKVYNQHIPQKALGHSPPLQAMKNWSQKQPQLFKKCAYNLAGLDSLYVRLEYRPSGTACRAYPFDSPAGLRECSNAPPKTVRPVLEQSSSSLGPIHR